MSYLDSGGDDPSKHEKPSQIEIPQEIRHSQREKTLTTRGKEYHCEREKSNRQLIYKRWKRQMTLIESLLTCVENIDNVNNQTVILDNLFSDLIASSTKINGFLEDESEQNNALSMMDQLDEEMYQFKQRTFQWLAVAVEKADKESATSSSSLSTKASTEFKLPAHSRRSKSKVETTSLYSKHSKSAKEKKVAADLMERASVHSKASSHLSRRSTESTRQRAYIAGLKAEVDEIHKTHELARKAEKLRFEAAETEMQAEVARLNTEIAKSKAIKKVYDEDVGSSDDEIYRHVKRSEKDEMKQLHSEISTVSLAMIKMLNLQSVPQISIDMFSGDYMEYQYFIATFEEVVESKISDQMGRLTRLIKYTSGEAKELIKHCIHEHPSTCYTTAKGLLRKQYGDPHRIASAYLKELRQWPNLKAGDSSAFRKFYRFLLKCKTCKNSGTYLNDLDAPDILRTLQSKLPYNLQDRWNRKVITIRSKQEKEVTFIDFFDMIEVETMIANDPMYSREALNESKERKIRDSNTSKLGSFVIGAKEENVQCVVCEAEHDLDDCQEFMKLNIEGRKQLIFRKRLCFACYGEVTDTHQAKTCKHKRKCKECNGNHPTGLHEVMKVRLIHTPEMTEEATINMCVLPVKLRHTNSSSEIIVYAMLDECSQGTFIDENIIQLLNIENHGRNTSLTIKTMNGESTKSCKAFSGLVVEAVEPYNTKYSSMEIKLPTTYTRSELPIDRDEIPTLSKIKEWRHLSSIINDIPECDESIPIGLLIGGNCPKALEPHELVPSKDDGPFAFRSRLGWCVVGPGKKAEKRNALSCNRIEMKDISTNKVAKPKFQVKDVDIQDVTIENVLFAMYNTEFVENVCEKKALSVEDKRFLQIIEEGVKKFDGHYEVPLPFRDPNLQMPNDKPYVIQRLKSVETKLHRDLKFHSDYTTFMNDLLSKGYAKKVNPDKVDCEDGKVWYVPHHAVYHPKKPDKIRIVFDCSASYRGVSLNSELLQGPDLTNHLIGVLLRFRKEHIPFMADIESMFYQVKIPENQRSFVRFMWWPDGDLQKEICEYEMCVHLFGASSSPSCCNFALRKTASENKCKFGKAAAETLNCNFYVDDLLKSEDSVEKAVKLIQDVRDMCAEGGFKLTKFCSSNSEVMQALPANDHAVELNNCDISDNHNVERALGVQWCIREDTFGFKIIEKEKPLTRRGLLSTISSIYDPLGLVGPFLLKGRKILQEITMEKLGWDAELSDIQIKRWLKWTEQLYELKDLKIPRCYKPEEFHTVIDASLHAFSDASMEGYGVAIYLRLVNEIRQIHVSLVFAKSRVSPMKSITIPRLELTAATVSAKVMAMVKEELSMPNLREFYWTDSQIVLGYIGNESQRYRIFVANRIDTIRKYTQINQWKYIKGIYNPADYASRGIKLSSVDKVNQWFNGPNFLWEDEIQWNCKDNTNFTLSEVDPELKTISTVNTISIQQGLLNHFEERFSSWYHLKRTVAIVLKFITKCKQNQSVIKRKAISSYLMILPEELYAAEIVIVKLLQARYFKEDLSTLKKLPSATDRASLRNKKVVLKKVSSLFKLDPFLDKEGVIRVGGRLERSLFEQEVKHPMILPKESNISDLFIRWCHESVQHGGRGFTLNEIRSNGYWIISCSSKVKQLIFRCVTCRNLRGHLGEQKMAPLPCERTLCEPPFTHCGVDMFGPFYTKEGRKELKRYGALFTCFSCRAVHIEMTKTMETDSFILALRRFLSRRGPVKSIRSDNGTNFIGTENEFRKALQKMDNDKIHSFLLTKGSEWITWETNPPAASHMGGVWERQIRSVRTVLVSLMNNHPYRLDDESLCTLFTEAESIVNCRPLTTDLIDDPQSLSPLTPNHILTMKSKVLMPPPGVFQKEDLYCRKRWRMVQYLANEFWKRWKNEFLQSLQMRSKWNKIRRNFCEGDIVLLKDESLKRNHWPMARIVNVYPDKDGLVRQVQLRVSNAVGLLTRPITKLVLLLESNVENK